MFAFTIQNWQLLSLHPVTAEQVLSFYKKLVKC